MTDDTYDAWAGVLLHSAGKLNHHNGSCLDLFEAIGCFEPAFIEPHQASNMICKVRPLKS